MNESGEARLPETASHQENTAKLRKYLARIVLMLLVLGIGAGGAVQYLFDHPEAAKRLDAFAQAILPSEYYGSSRAFFDNREECGACAGPILDGIRLVMLGDQGTEELNDYRYQYEKRQLLREEFLRLVEEYQTKEPENSVAQQIFKHIISLGEFSEPEKEVMFDVFSVLQEQSAYSLDFQNDYYRALLIIDRIFRILSANRQDALTTEELDFYLAKNLPIGSFTDVIMINQFFPEVSIADKITMIPIFIEHNESSAELLNFAQEITNNPIYEDNFFAFQLAVELDAFQIGPDIDLFSVITPEVVDRLAESKLPDSVLVRFFGFYYLGNSASVTLDDNSFFSLINMVEEIYLSIDNPSLNVMSDDVLFIFTAFRSSPERAQKTAELIQLAHRYSINNVRTLFDLMVIADHIFPTNSLEDAVAIISEEAQSLGVSIETFIQITRNITIPEQRFFFMYYANLFVERYGALFPSGEVAFALYMNTMNQAVTLGVPVTDVAFANKFAVIEEVLMPLYGDLFERTPDDLSWGDLFDFFSDVRGLSYSDQLESVKQLLPKGPLISVVEVPSREEILFLDLIHTTTEGETRPAVISRIHLITDQENLQVDDLRHGFGGGSAILAYRKDPGNGSQDVLVSRIYNFSDDDDGISSVHDPSIPIIASRRLLIIDGDGKMIKLVRTGELGSTEDEIRENLLKIKGFKKAIELTNFWEDPLNTENSSIYPHYIIITASGEFYTIYLENGCSLYGKSSKEAQAVTLQLRDYISQFEIQTGEKVVGLARSDVGKEQVIVNPVGDIFTASINVPMSSNSSLSPEHLVYRHLPLKKQ